MGSQKKTAKFMAKGNLKKTLKKRNERKKINAQRQKKQQRRDQSKKPAAVDEVEAAAKPDEPDMMDEMDVDEFLNGNFLESDPEDAEETAEADDDQAMDDQDDSSSEEEDEDALDPRYMQGLPKLPEIKDDDDEDQEQDEAGEDEDAQEEEEQVDAAAKQTITMDMLTKVEKEAFEKNSASALRQLIRMFSDACRSGSAADTTSLVYEVHSSAVYTKLMMDVFRRAHVSFMALVTGKSADDKGKSVDEKKWKRNALVLRRFFQCVRYLLEETTASDVHVFVLRELQPYIPLLTPAMASPTAKKLLRTLLKAWANSVHQPQVTLLAFVRIREMALQLPFPFLELCLKGTYVFYMRQAKFTNETTRPHHVLLGNCVVELYGLDFASSYQHAFVYLRQLAIALRKTITSPSADSFKAVLNWKFVNQLKVWTAVVCAYPDESQLRPLIYPLCQLLLAQARLASTLRFAPLRFQCVRFLQQIAAATNHYVPAAPLLLELFEISPFDSSYQAKRSKGKHAKALKGSTAKMDLDVVIKLAKATVEDRHVHDLVFDRLMQLLQREVDLHRFDIALPEWSLPVEQQLSKYVKNCLVPKWKSQAKSVLEHLRSRAKWMRDQRAGAEFAPSDMKQAEAFMQKERKEWLAKLASADRDDVQKALTQAQEVVEATPAPVTKATKKKKKQGEKPKAKATSEAPVEDVEDADMEEEDQVEDIVSFSDDE